MLCDELVAYGRSKRGNDGESRFTRRIADLCSQGERFVLDNEAVDVVMNVEESLPTTLASALAICRLPYPVLWVEEDMLYRMRRTGDYGYEVNIPKGAKDLRGGLLLVASDDTLQRGRVYSVSSERKQKFPVLNPLCLEFDLSPQNALMARMKRDDIYSFLIKPNYYVDVKASLADLETNSYTKKIRKQPEQVKTLLSLEHRFLANIDDDASEWVTSLRWSLTDSSFKEFIRATIIDFQGERRWIIGLLLLLNSRNLFTLANNSVAAKNKNRSPRIRPYTISHKTLNIHLSRVVENRLRSQGSITPQQVAWHKVRGHWKVRKTGVYFWRPHTRGSADVGLVEKTYHVTR